MASRDLQDRDSLKREKKLCKFWRKTPKKNFVFLECFFPPFLGFFQADSFSSYAQKKARVSHSHFSNNYSSHNVFSIYSVPVALLGVFLLKTVACFFGMYVPTYEKVL